jgi:hypothetical protein
MPVAAVHSSGTKEIIINHATKQFRLPADGELEASMHKKKH